LLFQREKEELKQEIQHLHETYKQQMYSIQTKNTNTFMHIQQQISNLTQHVLQHQQSTTDAINIATEHFSTKIQMLQQQLDTHTAPPAETHFKIPLLTTAPRPLAPPPGYYHRFGLNPPASMTSYRLTTPSHTSHSDTHSAPLTPTDTTDRKTYATTAAKPTTSATTSHTHSQATAPRTQIVTTATAKSEPRSQKSSTQPRKKTKHYDSQSHIGFVSDSTMKFLTEDKTHTLPYILNHSMENNIRLHRGATAETITTQTDYKQLRSNGVTNLVASFGTVDLLNMHTNSQTPAQVAQSVAASVTNFTTNAIWEHKMNTLYIIPGYNSRISETDYTHFHTQITALLQQENITHISLSDIMQTHAGQSINSYSDVIEDTLTDGIHLQFTTGRTLLQTALNALNTTCDIQQSDISPAYIAVQKHTEPGTCYTCGEQSHTKQHCPLQQTTFFCNFCQESNTHTAALCPHKFQPCTHCGQMGHHGRRRGSCPTTSRGDPSLTLLSLSDTVSQ